MDSDHARVQSAVVQFAEDYSVLDNILALFVPSDNVGGVKQLFEGNVTERTSRAVTLKHC